MTDKKLSERWKEYLGGVWTQQEEDFIIELEALEAELEELRIPPVYTNAFIEDSIQENQKLKIKLFDAGENLDACEKQLSEAHKENASLKEQLEKVMPDASMFAGHSGILDRETAWQLTYSACKERAESAEAEVKRLTSENKIDWIEAYNVAEAERTRLSARLAKAQELVEKWRTQVYPDSSIYSGQLEKALGGEGG